MSPLVQLAVALGAAMERPEEVRVVGGLAMNLLASGSSRTTFGLARIQPPETPMAFLVVAPNDLALMKLVAMRDQDAADLLLAALEKEGA